MIKDYDEQAIEDFKEAMYEDRRFVYIDVGDKISEVVVALIFAAAIVAVIVSVLLVTAPPAHASDDTIKDRMVNACIGEAEGEPYKGKLAVMCAIINRTGTHGSFEKAMRGVYGEKALRVTNKKYSKKTLEDATRAYYEALEVGSCDFIGGADHWEGTGFKQPAWTKGMIVTATVGSQRFYKEK